MVSAVVVAGGIGSRFGASEGKQLAEAGGMPLVAWSLLAMESCADVAEVVLVGHPERLDEFERTVSLVSAGKVAAVVPGGDTRQRSVASGLRAVSSSAGVVCVQDGARPLVTSELVSRALAELGAHAEADGVVVGHPAYDTMKVVGPDGLVVDTPDRSSLWAAQTPQVFRLPRLREAYEAAERAGFWGTDDASLVEWHGGAVLMYQGPRDNVKVTVPEDLAYVEAVLAARGAAR